MLARDEVRGMQIALSVDAPVFVPGKPYEAPALRIQLLHEIKKGGALPLITKAADYDRSDPLFALDVRAQDLWSLGCVSAPLRSAGRDFTTGPVIL